jgi:pyruvate dehydrogenase E1 component beta subunit
MVMEAFRAAEFLSRVGIDVEVIDLRTLRPWDHATVSSSVRKTGHVMAADTGYVTCGMTAEVTAWCAENLFTYLKHAPVRVGSPDCPVPTTPALAKHFYPRSSNLVEKILEMFPGRVDKSVGTALIAELRKVEEERPHDVPDLKFTGPF